MKPEIVKWWEMSFFGEKAEARFCKVRDFANTLEKHSSAKIFFSFCVFQPKTFYLLTACHDNLTDVWSFNFVYWILKTNFYM